MIIGTLPNPGPAKRVLALFPMVPIHGDKLSQEISFTVYIWVISKASGKPPGTRDGTGKQLVIWAK